MLSIARYRQLPRDEASVAFARWTIRRALLGLFLCAQPWSLWGAEALKNGAHSSSLVNPAQYTMFKGFAVDLTRSRIDISSTETAEDTYTQEINQKIYTLPENQTFRNQVDNDVDSFLMIVPARKAPIVLGFGHTDIKQTATSDLLDYRQAIDTEDQANDVTSLETVPSQLNIKKARSIIAYDGGGFSTGIEATYADHVIPGQPHFGTINLVYGAALMSNLFQAGIAYAPKFNLTIDEIGVQRDPPELVVHGRSVLTREIALGGFLKRIFSSAVEEGVSDGFDLNLNMSYAFAFSDIEIDVTIGSDGYRALNDEAGIVKTRELALQYNLDFGGLLMHLDYRQSSASMSTTGATLSSVSKSLGFGVGMLIN